MTLEELIQRLRGQLQWTYGIPRGLFAKAADTIEELQAEVERLKADLAEECRWSVGWKDLARRAEAERDLLADGIRELQERIAEGAHKLDVMAEELPRTEENVRPHARLLAKAAGLRVALDYTRSLLDVNTDDKWTMTCPSCGATYDKSDDSRHEC